MPRALHPPRGEPTDDVGDFLIGHRLARYVSTPIRRTQFGTAGDDDRAQPLIADQSQKRIVRDARYPSVRLDRRRRGTIRSTARRRLRLAARRPRTSRRRKAELHRREFPDGSSAIGFRVVITSICLSVSIPPALCAKAGIDVPRTPFAITARIAASSTMPRYTGSASAMAAPPRPSAPWQPAQFSAYSVRKSDDLVRRQRFRTFARLAGRSAATRDQRRQPAPRRHRDSGEALTDVTLPFLAVPSFRELQFRRAGRTRGSRAW